MTGTVGAVPRHPAKYTAEILAAFIGIADAEADRTGHGLMILDPFAGTGRIHQLLAHGHQTYGVELEPEWAAAHERTEVGDALNLEYLTGVFDAVMVSPCYANRISDHHEAKDACKKCVGGFDSDGRTCKSCRGSGLSKRNTYKHCLGRDLTDGSSASMAWNDTYRTFHRDAWVEAIRVVKPDGLLVVNVKNHIRNHVEQHVAEWHLTCLLQLGCRLQQVQTVEVTGNRQGANGDARVPFELILVVRTPELRTPGHAPQGSEHGD